MSKIKVTEHWDNPKAIRIDIYEQFVEVKLPSRLSRIHFTKDEWVASIVKPASLPNQTSPQPKDSFSELVDEELNKESKG